MDQLDQAELDRMKDAFYLSGGCVRKMPPEATVEDLTTLPRDIRDEILWPSTHDNLRSRRKNLMSKKQAHSVEKLIAGGCSLNHLRNYLSMQRASAEQLHHRLWVAGIPYPERFKTNLPHLNVQKLDAGPNVFRQFNQIEVKAIVEVWKGRTVDDVAPAFRLKPNTLHDNIKVVFGGVNDLRMLADLSQFRRKNERFYTMQKFNAVSA